MPTVSVDLPHHRYDVHIEPGCLAQLGERVRAVAPHDRCALIAEIGRASCRERVSFTV